MAKKITLSMIVLLIISALVFVSCSQEAGGGGGVPGPAPTPKEKVVNVAGEVSANLVYNGDFESGGASDLTGDGASTSPAEGQGFAGSNALLVEQSAKYGEVVFDLTEYYGRGKSFYVEGWFKNVGGEGTRDDDLTAYLSFNIVSGGGYEYDGPGLDGHKPKGQTYDIPGQYDGSWLPDSEAEEIFGLETNCEGDDISDGEWHKVCAILDAEQIDAVLSSEDEQCHWTGEQTMYLLSAVFFVGTYPEQDGYKYLLDNVVIKDLNKELARQGATYEAPDEPEPEPEPEEEEEGED